MAWGRGFDQLDRQSAAPFLVGDNALGQGTGLGRRLDAQLVTQKATASLVVAQGRSALTAACQSQHQLAVGDLAQVVDLQLPPGIGHRFAVDVPLYRAYSQAIQRLQHHAAQIGPSRLGPLLEGFAAGQVEVGQEVAVIEGDSLGQLKRGGLRILQQSGKAQDIYFNDRRRVELYCVAVGQHQGDVVAVMRVDLRESLAQDVEVLPQILLGGGLRPIGPEQRHQAFAAVASRLAGQVAAEGQGWTKANTIERFAIQCDS